MKSRYFFTAEIALTRFANNTIHQNVAEENYGVSVRTVFGGRTARATTNKFDDESLKRWCRLRKLGKGAASGCGSCCRCQTRARAPCHIRTRGFPAPLRGDCSHNSGAASGGSGQNCFRRAKTQAHHRRNLLNCGIGRRHLQFARPCELAYADFVGNSITCWRQILRAGKNRIRQCRKLDPLALAEIAAQKAPNLQILTKSPRESTR